MNQPLFENGLSPEKLFRLIALVCLVVMGGALIYFASHASQPDADPVPLTRARDLASYSFTALLIFVFFYLQYRFVPRITKVGLNERLGFVQSLGGAALLLLGALHAVLPQTAFDVPSGVLFWLTLLGEGVFMANVVWSSTHPAPSPPVLPRVDVSKPAAPKLGDETVKNLGWPKSPVKLFAIGAGFFAGGGFVSLTLDFPAFKFPVPWSGQLHFLPIGLLWLACAVPFAIFAMLYRVAMDSYALVFEDSMNRIHFFVTIFAALFLVRTFAAWQNAMTSKTAALFFAPQFGWLYLLFLMSALVFCINAYRAYQRNLSRK